MKLETFFTFKRFCEATGNKMHMSEETYRKLKKKRLKSLKECESLADSAQEITDNDFSTSNIIFSYEEAKKEQALTLDINNTYGGVIIQQYCNEHGGVSHPFGSSRAKEADFVNTLHFTLSAFFSVSNK